jgi:hypothetical protein
MFEQIIRWTNIFMKLTTFILCAIASYSVLLLFTGDPVFIAGHPPLNWFMASWSAVFVVKFLEAVHNG